MAVDSLRVEKPREGVALLTLNRAGSHNALDVAMFDALRQTVSAMADDDDVRVIILTGAGEKAFSAGYDVKELQHFTPDQQRLDYYERDQWMWTVAACSKPVIAALNGFCYGGGAVLATACDIRIGSARSTFKVTAAAYGGVNATWTLPPIVGTGVAKEWLLTGRLVSAEEAKAHGLLNHLVEPEQVLPKAIEIAEMIAGNPIGSSRAVKLLIDDNIGRGRSDAHRAETTHLLNELPPAPVSQLFAKFLAKSEA